VGVYANALGNGFVLDAEPLIASNPLVADLSRVSELVRSDYWRPELVSGLYRPVVTTSWALQHALGARSPVAHNAVNLLLHAAVCLLAWRVYRRLGVRASVALGGALLFATHAVHSEVVANAVGRAELLASLFTLTAFLAYLRGRAAPGGAWGWAALAAASFALAVLSKENAALLVALIPFHALLYGQGDGLRARLGDAWQRSGRPWLALLAVGAACGGLRLWALGAAATPDPNGIDNPLVRLEGAAHVLTALQVLLIYGRLLILPTRLSYDYSYDVIPLLDPADPRAWAVVCAVAALVGLGVWSLRHSRPLAFGLGLTVLAWLPVSNLVVTTGTILGERLAYLPSVGFCLALALAAHGLCRHIAGRSGRVGRSTSTLGLFALGMGLVVLGHGARTWVRNADWRSESRLVLHDVAVVPGSTKTQANAGKALQDQGRHLEAITHFERALAIAPENSVVYTNWAYSLGALGRHREAARLLETQLRRGHGHAALYNNLGFLLVEHEIDVARGVGLIERAVAERPDEAEFLDSLGWGYFKQGRLHDARGALERSLELAPDGPTRAAREAHLRAVQAALRAEAGAGPAPAP